MVGRRWREWALAALLLVPALALFGVFFFYPFIRIIGWGFYEPVQRGTAYAPAGFSQYVDVLTGSEFWDGVWISVKYVLFTVPAGLALGTLLAVVANQRLKGINFFRTIFSSTVATSVAVASVIFLVLLSPTQGVFQVNLLDNPDWALFGIALSSVWQNMGLSFIIVLAGLQAIPDEVIEASHLDGYSAPARFFKITLPMLWPVMTFLIVVLTVFAFQAFAQPEILTQGGPAGTTETLVFKIFQRQSPTTITEGSVLSVGLFLLTAVFTFTQFLLLDRRLEDG
jgi:sn-glycerol 3-phosphate transport system permease protein